MPRSPFSPLRIARKITVNVVPRLCHCPLLSRGSLISPNTSASGRIIPRSSVCLHVFLSLRPFYRLLVRTIQPYATSEPLLTHSMVLLFYLPRLRHEQFISTWP